ncbi:MAG: DnaJ domain-containing protein [Archangium sp.]|nr:DnaJ domain-containing protein [Archangium sp.]
MEDNIDIDGTRQLEILDLEVKASSNDYFHILGVPAGAPPDVVKEAFYALSRKFHPDRYFGKNLGSFKPKLDKLFRKLVEANQTLTDADKRKKYLEAHPKLAEAAAALEAKSTPTPEPKSAAQAQRDVERRARLNRHPYLAKTSKVQEMVSAAKTHIAKGEFGHAFTQLNLAAQYDAQNSEVKGLLNDVRRKHEEGRSDIELKRANDALGKGDTEAALTAFKAAVNFSPRNAVAAFKIATILEKRGGDPKESSGYAQKAVDAEPTNVEYRLVLARLLVAGGMKALAKKHFEEAQRLAPDHPEVKKHAKSRWPF